MYQFFLSYSNFDKSKYVDKFFEDLRKEVYRKIGDKSIDIKSVAFKDDVNIDSGTRWTETLTYAIRSTQTLICLYTRGYFNSEYCGKEFNVFSDRVSQYELTPNSHKNPSLIFPIIWENPQILRNTFPTAIQNIQHSEKEYGDQYSKMGLQIMVRNSRFREAYQLLIENLATKIVTTTDEVKLPEYKDVNMDDIASAFNLKDSQDNHFSISPSLSGPKSAKFVFVAGNKAEISKIKKNTDCYGAAGGKDWLPYFPEDEEVGIIAQRIAVNQKMHFENLEITNSFIDTLRKAENDNTVVVIIIDPWSINLDKFKKKMQDYDGLNFINSYIAIPWNENDEDSIKLAEDINQNMEEILCHCAIHRELELQTRSKSVMELEEIVALGIQKAKANIMKLSKNRRLIDKNFTNIPTLIGSGTIK